MKMTNPSDLGFWENAKEIAKIVTPWLSGAWVFHTGINRIFKYFSDSRDAELREIVKKEVQPKLDELSRKIDQLSEIIYQLKNK